jgi:hypothetical protein
VRDHGAGVGQVLRHPRPQVRREDVELSAVSRKTVVHDPEKNE